MRWLIFASVLVALASCGRQQEQSDTNAARGDSAGGEREPAETPRGNKEAEVWIFVEGMTKVQGIT